MGPKKLHPDWECSGSLGVAQEQGYEWKTIGSLHWSFVVVNLFFFLSLMKNEGLINMQFIHHTP